MSRLEPPKESSEQQLRSACLGLQQSLRAGKTCRAEDYFADLPALSADPDSALDLIYTEYLARVELGQQALKEEFCQRFPQWQEALQRQFEWHELIGASGLMGPGELSPASGAFGPCTEPGAPDQFWGSRYQVLHEIGRGAMGIVYLAWQTALNRLAALKMILAGPHATPEEWARFRVEAEAVARLQHPNIVQIYEVGEESHCPFLALEYVEGGSLAQKTAGQPLPAYQAALLTEKLARAIHYAHQRGIVHRDLTPANVLLTEEGEPKITDFGLAKVTVGGGMITTRSNVVLGTPDYMAPEQAEGKIRETGPVSDIYALGAILYELLTGQTPSKGETWLETLQNIRFREPKPPGRVRSGLPRDVQTICLKCLEKDPGRRYASAELLADDLRRFLEGKPIQARPHSLVGQAVRWVWRHVVLAGLLALLAGVFLVSLGW